MSWSGIYNDQSPTYACTGQTFTYTTPGNALVVGNIFHILFFIILRLTQQLFDVALRSQATGFAGGMFRCQVVAQLNTVTGTIGLPIGTGATGLPIGTNIGNIGK